MNYITAEEASKLWKIGLRTVQRMCASGQIEGAEKFSNIWMIPENAKPNIKRKNQNGTTKEEIIKAYKCFLFENYSKYNKFFGKNNNCTSSVTKAYYTMVEAYKHYPKIEDMVDYWEKSRNYLKGTDIKIPELSLTMGGHYTLSMFLREPGNADKVRELIEEKIPVFDRVTGKKSGLPLLFKAELAYRRGDIHEAELLSYKSMFVQDENPDITIGISSVLAHAAIYKGNVDGWKQAVEMIKKLEVDNELTQASVEIAKSDLLLICDYTERVPEWLQNADFKDKNLSTSARYNAIFIHLSYLLKKKEYAKLIAYADFLLEKVDEEYFVSYYSLIYLYTLMAACYNKIYMENMCIKYLKKALELAKPDSLVMPFVEYSDYLGEVSSIYMKRNEPEIYEKILKIQMTYSENLLSLKGSLKEPELSDSLTDREKEIANLVAEGMANAEIAEKLYISKSTVNYHIQNIFNKLGVNRRSMMIKLLFFNDKNDN